MQQEEPNDAHESALFFFVSTALVWALVAIAWGVPKLAATLFW